MARKISLTDNQVKKIKEIKGIYIEAVPKRFYPNQSLLSQTIGFVGLDNKGLSGLEYVFDEKLRGKAKVIKYIKDAKGRPLKFESIDSKNSAKSLYLTIDKDLQSMAKKHLKKLLYQIKQSRVEWVSWMLKRVRSSPSLTTLLLIQIRLKINH